MIILLISFFNPILSYIIIDIKIIMNVTEQQKVRIKNIYGYCVLYNHYFMENSYKF